jgi:predicted ATPase
MSPLTLRAKHFRVLDDLEWSPEGLCLLAGANGTGKTTVLDLLKFLRNLFERGAESAFSSIDGGHIRSRGTVEKEPVRLELEIGEARWVLSFPMSEKGIDGTYGEALFHAGKPVLQADMHGTDWLLGDERVPRDRMRCCARVFWDRHDPSNEPDWMRPLVSILSGISIYGSFWLNQVRLPDNRERPASFLHGTGNNLWSVLSNWKAAPFVYRGQYEWVMTEASQAFPGLVGTIEFDRGQPFLFPPDATDPADGFPPERAAAGLLTGLLQLTAIAGAQPDSIIAFDEIENHLHPHAIRSILSALRQKANERNLTVIVTTHSPVVMNAFRQDPEQVYLLELGVSPTPVALTDLHDEGWLAAFMLGDLYDRLEIAAPRISAKAG